MAAASAQVAVRWLRGDACAAAGELPAAPGGWGGGDLGGAGCEGRRLGFRPIAAGLGRPASTVRDWLARFAGQAGAVRALFTVWLCALDADPPPLAPAGSLVADAVAAVTAAAAAAGRRWAGRLVSLSPGELASSVSGGLLLAPGFAPEWINTSSS